MSRPAENVCFSHGLHQAYDEHRSSPWSYLMGKNFEKTRTNYHEKHPPVAQAANRVCGRLVRTQAELPLSWQL